jgi:hypothetical protein
VACVNYAVGRADWSSVGEDGSKGVVEISDLMFTTKGRTAGVVLIEWNVHEDNKGSAAMWDVIVRVGGAAGTDLTVENCLWSRRFQRDCMSSSMMLHVTPKASIYMENMWFWVAGTKQAASSIKERH